ncbi:RNase P/RNase MRP complex subunit [Mortierella sp. GBA35]|nr:RNase P/RNase MRP complex subunit [Mortierella sp. GBA35]KAF9099457.1 RNase P/RNase MRP complex subunit [Mortierella sp. AD031]KAG0219919.1 RNase P/RNase MRP complex subunit [Mortierella sp. NVP41]
MENQNRPELSLYSRLPETVHRSAGLEGESSTDISSKNQAFVPGYVENSVVDGYEADKVFSTKVKNKVFALDNPTKDLSAAKEAQRRRKRANKAKVLNAKEKRQLNVYDIPLESRKYELFEPLHQLWKGYVEELFGNANPVGFTQKLLKADFHGAIITVARSKCPSYIGTTGIVAQETENVFKIITPTNALRVIPKVNSVFTIHIKNSVFTLHGNQFRYRAAQRSAKKFKSRPTIDL